MNDQKRVLILGVGRRGTAISWCMTVFGHHVIGADKDIASAEKLRRGELKRNTPVDFLIIETEEDIEKSMYEEKVTRVKGTDGYYTYYDASGKEISKDEYDRTKAPGKMKLGGYRAMHGTSK